MKGYEQIADYAWIKKGRKYWNIYLGNPFCLQPYQTTIEMPKEELEQMLINGQEEVKKDFIERFPDVIWECYLKEK